jgi:hypothetical protein
VLSLSCRSGLQSDQSGDSHGKSTVVVLPIDPYRVHVYWTIEPPGLLEDVSGATPVLRFHSIPLTSLDVEDSAEFFDVQIELDAPNWYVQLPKPMGRYLVELGASAEDGRFSVLARSGLVQTPPASPSENDEETSMLVLGDLLLPHPSPGYRRDDVPNDLPIPQTAANALPGNHSALNSDFQRKPVTPVPTSRRPDAFDSGQTTGPVHTESSPDEGSEASARHPLAESNERSFASGLSSILLGG